MDKRKCTQCALYTKDTLHNLYSVKIHCITKIHCIIKTLKLGFVSLTLFYKLSAGKSIIIYDYI